MMIALIDDRDADRRAGKTMRHLHTAEAGADDDDMMKVRLLRQSAPFMEVGQANAV